jgi:BASS family bile acid:Na+ symporter
MRVLFLILLALSVALGLGVPSGGHLKFLLPWLLGTMLFFNFLEIRIRFQDLFKRELIYYPLMVLVLLPALIYLLSFPLDKELRMGLFMIAIAPTAIGASVITALTGGNILLTVSNTVISNLLSIVYYPLLIRLYFHSSELTIPVLPMMIHLALVIVIPFALSFAFRELRKRIRGLDPFLTRAGRIAPFLLPLLVYIAASSSSKELRLLAPQVLITAGLFTLGVAVLYFAAGFLTGRNLPDRLSLAGSFGQKNTGLCILLAVNNFSPLTAVPATLYILFHHLIYMVLIGVTGAKKKKQSVKTETASDRSSGDS